MSAISYVVIRHRDGSKSYLVLETEGEPDLFVTTRPWAGDDKMFVSICGQRLVATSVPPPELQDNNATKATTDDLDVQEVERRTITFRE